MPDENRPSWRPQDENQGPRDRRSMSDDDDHGFGARDDDRFMHRERERMATHWDDRTSRWDDRDDRYRSAEYDPQGGYGGGRYDRDRQYGSRSAMYPSGEYGMRNRDVGVHERSDREHLGGYSQERERGDDGYGYGGQGYGYGGESNIGRGFGGGVYQGNLGGYGQVQGGYRQGRDDQMGGGYLGQGGQQMGYGRDISQRGSQDEARYGQGGMPQRYGSQSFQGYGPQGVGALQGGWNQQQGMGMGPSFRGKGPSGYVRSDERIKEIVCEVLTDHEQIDATHIDVNVKNGEVTLSGTVDDRRQKRLAEDAIENLSFVKDVTNQLRVGEKKSASAVTSSGKEQELQGPSDKRHRA